MSYPLKILISCWLVGVSLHLEAAPIPAACTPNTLNYCCSFGITRVTFNSIYNPSNNGQDGYGNFTAQSTTLLEGQSYLLEIKTNALSTQNFAAWIDFNNDGSFDDATERVFTATSQHSPSGTVVIPTGAVLNTDLRLRIIADYDLNAAPMPCTDPTQGQAEDYTVVIIQNPNYPTAAFTTAATLVCDGEVCFTDNSLHVPTSWVWYFGDGATSLLQNPCHTYTADGTYTVSLTATNANGSHADTIIDYITVNTAGQVTPANCTPATTSYCCDYGIVAVDLADIHHTTPDGVEGYQDFSCAHATSVYEGLNYLLSVNTGTANPQNTSAWIDFNNDGVFTTNERVMDAPNSFSPAQHIAIPFGAVLHTPLRLRIKADIVGGAELPCDANDRGQTEDYGIIIQASNSISEREKEAAYFRIYPNPVWDVLHLKNLTNATIRTLNIHNALGQQVERITNTQKDVIRIDVSNYNKGIYSVSIQTSTTVVVKKFIVH